MLKLYVCPKCKTIRYVSRKNITCFKCNTQMLLSNVSYSDFIAMSPEARLQCIKHTLQQKK